MVSKIIIRQLFTYYSTIFIRTFWLLTPIVLFFYQENGLNYKHLFLFQGVFYLTSIIMEFPIGYLVDNHSRKKIFYGSFLLLLLVSMLWFSFRGFWIILVGEILMAISKVIFDNNQSGYLYDYLYSNKIHRSMPKCHGYVTAAVSLGIAAASIIGAVIYEKYGSSIVLIVQMIMLVIGMILLLYFPDIKKTKDKILERSERLKSFWKSTKKIYNNNSIKYHIYTSGLLTAISVLFAISFQPFMQKAIFPVFLFGVVTFLNHSVRALSGFLAGKVNKLVSIKSLVPPLYFSYLIAFLLVFLILYKGGFVLTAIIITILCMIIGFQLLFSVLHVSRIHRFVGANDRGNLMAINNFVSRGFTAIILLSSKLLMDKFNLYGFYGCIFLIFIIFGTYFMFRTYKESE